MPKFEVVVEIDVTASSPERAATMVRDALIDPESDLFMRIHPYVWCDEADDEFPTEMHGWEARFENGGVRPSFVFEWQRLKA